MATSAAWTVLMRVCERLIGLASTIVLARLLAPADFGIIAMAMSVAAIFEALTAFGVEVALIQRQTSERKYYDAAWSLNVILGAGKCLLGLIAAPLAAQLYGEPRVAPIMAALAFMVAISGARNIGMVGYEQDLQFARVFHLTLARKLSSFAVAIGAALLIGNYWALVAGMLAGALVDFVLSYSMHPYRPKLNFQAARELLGFSKWLLANNVLYFLNHRSFDFIIGRQAGAGALGTYTVAYEIASLPTTELVHPIMRAVFPGYAKLGGDREELARAYLSVFALLSAVVVPAAAGLACIAGPVVAIILGPKWLDAVSLIEVLALAGGVRALQANTGSVYLALGKPHLLTAVQTLYIIIAAPLFVALLLGGSLSQAVWALVVAGVVTAVVNFSMMVRLLGVRVVEIVGYLIRPGLASALMAGVLTWILQSVSQPRFWGEQLVSLAALLLVGVFIYTAAIAALWFVGGRPLGPESLVLSYLRSAWRS
jgi:PST family polysaccharide transporter